MFVVLSGVFVHGHGGGHAYIQALDLAILQYFYLEDIREIFGGKAEAEFFVAESKGCFVGEHAFL